MIAKAQGKELLYELTDFHSARPGHDLRYALNGDLLKSLGWEPKIKFSERVQQVVEWSLANKRWLNK
jgi:dTDP-glucose 4,6-dehydratase